MRIHLEDGVGLWAERISDTDFSGCSTLFLDRDGVIVEEVNYLGRAGDVRMIPDIGNAIAAANDRGIAVVMVTNQAGIARGYYDWGGFRDVQDRILGELAAAGATIDAVFACGYHAEGHGALKLANHPWRKPSCGMLKRAEEMLSIDLSRSHIVGDTLSDLEAGANAGLPSGALVLTGHGSREAEHLQSRRIAWDRERHFSAATAQNGAEAIFGWLERL